MAYECFAVFMRLMSSIGPANLEFILHTTLVGHDPTAWE